MREERKMSGALVDCQSNLKNKMDLDPWTDDELDYLDRIGQNTITVDKAFDTNNKTIEEVLEWSEEIDVLDLETDQYLED